MQQNNLAIHSMLCIPTERTYRDVYHRSFSLGLNQQTANNISNYLASSGVSNYEQLSITSAAANIGTAIKLSAVPDGKADIINGWSTQRLMFILIVDEAINASTMYTHYIQGFSEYYDPSYSGKLDENASYYINSITTVIRVRNPVTNAMSSRVTSTYNVVYDHTGTAAYKLTDAPGSNLDMIRPTDVLSNLYSRSTYADVDGLVIKSSSITDGANVSKRSNSDPLKYFTDTINSVICGKSMSVDGMSANSVLSSAGGLVSEQSIVNNGFVRMLARLTGILEPYWFTLNTLRNIDPLVSEKITLVRSGSMMRDTTAYDAGLDTDDTADMLNYTAELDVAQTFINSLTSNMSENLVNVISGTVTNITGVPVTTITQIRSFLEGVDITPYGNRIVNYTNSVIMPQLTINNMRLVSIVFECDLLGDTTVSVSVDNSSPVIYRLPTFADSLYSPVLTNTANKEAVIDDFEVVVDTVMAMSPENNIGVYNGY